MKRDLRNKLHRMSLLHGAALPFIVWGFCLSLVACATQNTAVPTPAFVTPPLSASASMPPSGAFNDLSFDYIGTEQGLSQSSVTAIMQDSHGFLWFGTFDGLNRYDGYQFTIFKFRANDPGSISGNLIWRLLESRDSTIWIATQGDGISQYDPATEKFRRFRHREEDPGSLAADFVQAILEDSRGTLWVGTINGLDRFEPETGGFTHYRNDFDPPEVTFGSNLIEDICEDSRGHLWLATRNGLITFDPLTGVFTRHEIDPQNAGANTVLTAFIDEDGLLWASTLGGLYVLERETLEVVRFVADPVRKGSETPVLARVIHEDPFGNVWVGTQNGLARLDKQRDEFVPMDPKDVDVQALAQANVLAITTDNSGILWFGTLQEGIRRFDPWRGNFRHISVETGQGDNTLSSNDVWAVAEDNQGIYWIGTAAGLDRWDRTHNIWVHWQPHPRDPPKWTEGGVWLIYPDADQMLWMASSSGLVRFDPRAGRVLYHLQMEAFDPHGGSGAEIYSLYRDREGNLWIGVAGAGLSKIDAASGELKHYRFVRGDLPLETLEENSIWSIIEDQDTPGLLWLGTHSGLARFQDGAFTFFPHDPASTASPSHNQVGDVYQDQTGALWLATAGGLDRYDPADGSYRHFYEGDGLPDENIASILPDDQGRLWLSTNRGISRFDPASATFRNYDTSDGLQGLEFTSGFSYKNRRGELLMGGPNGFNLFDPSAITDRQHVPPVVITELQIFNRKVDIAPDAPLQRPVNLTDRITLSRRDTVFTLELAALDFAAPEDNQYAYIMEGFDTEWNYLGNRRHATYTNLPPGDYTFRAIASNADGIWNLQGTSLAINIPKPFWQTWWFLTLLLLTVTGSAVGVVRLRTAAIAARNLELEEMVAARTQDLTALYTIAAVVGRSLDMEETLTSALDAVLNLMPCDAAAIHLLAKSGNELELAAHRGLPASTAVALASLPVEGLLEPAIRNSSPVIARETELLPILPADDGLAGLADRWVITPLMSRKEVLGILLMNLHPGREHGESSRALLLGIGNQIGAAVDNARFFADVQLRAEQFRLINEVGRRISSILDQQQVLQEVVQLIRDTFGYYHVGIGIVEGDEVVYRVGSGELWDDPDFAFRPARLMLGSQGLTGWVAQTGQALLVPDVSQEPRYVWMQGSKTRSELLVPVIVKEEIIGVLDVQSEQNNYFDETDKVVMQLLATQTGIALENARLYEQAQQLAVAQERNRLARDLHDAVTQTLFSASLIAEALPELWRHDPAEGALVLGELRQLTRGALAEMRTLLLELRPESLTEARLGDLLQQLAAAAAGRIGVAIDVSVDELGQLPENVRVGLYRIAQEALNNVVKHARASRVSLVLGKVTGDGGVRLSVQDNGRGFDPSSVSADHLGLGILRERAENMGASLDVESQPGQGTTVTAVWQDG